MSNRCGAGVSSIRLDGWAVADLGFDETFCRLWVLYFAYFEAGFRARYCDVWQVGIRRNP